MKKGCTNGNIIRDSRSERIAAETAMLYEVRDAIKKQFGRREFHPNHVAEYLNGVEDLDALGPALEILQGRYRGRRIGTPRPASQGELTDARIGMRWIIAFARTV